MRILRIALLLATVHCASVDAGLPRAGKAQMIITGVVTSEGVECPAVRGEDGTLYTVVGKGREQLQPGRRVRITGQRAEMSICMQGITIEATVIEVLTAS